MEREYSFIISVVISGALLLGAFKVLNWVWIKPKKLEKQLKEQGLKGNPYTLLYGDFRKMKRMFKESHSKPIGFSDPIATRVMPLFHEAIQNYGKNTYVWLGPMPAVLIMDPENVKEVALKYNIFEKPHITNPLAKFLIRGLLCYEGDKWAKHRKIVNPAFHQEKLKFMIPAFHQSSLEIVRKWEAMVSSTGSSEVDVWPYLNQLTSDAISRTAFGSSYEKARRIFELQKDQTELLQHTIQSVYIPGLRFLPTKMNRRIKLVCDDVKSSIKSIIDARMKALGAGQASENDLLSILLESNFKEMKEHGNKDFGLSIDDVIEECRLFYFAGQETTSGLLTWTMIMLSKYPQWQSRAREEVLQLFGTNMPDIKDINHLKIVTMILYEVLRMYPPGGILPRIATQDMKLGKLNVPAGVLIILPVMLLHVDKEIWGEDTMEFNPERFSEGVSQATNGQAAFFPFGWGPRTCIGQNFAMLEAKIALALILHRFSFELSPSYSHSPISVVTLKPQHGAHLVLHKIQ